MFRVLLPAVVAVGLSAVVGCSETASAEDESESGFGDVIESTRTMTPVALFDFLRDQGHVVDLRSIATDHAAIDTSTYGFQDAWVTMTHAHVDGVRFTVMEYDLADELSKHAFTEISERGYAWTDPLPFVQDIIFYTDLTDNTLLSEIHHHFGGQTNLSREILSPR